MLPLRSLHCCHYEIAQKFQKSNWIRQVRTTWRDVFERGLPYDIEYRSYRPDGTIRWIHARGRGYYDDAGNPLCMVGVVFDITERKEFERERVELSGRLIQAQEDERTRLARDLHDDLGQEMALMAGELELELHMLDAQPKVRQRLSKLLERVKEIGVHIQLLSHSLHSSRLEISSLSRNVGSFCKEFSALHKIQVHFDCTGIPESIPLDLKVGLFRIVQEALHNVNKHSRASRGRSSTLRKPPRDLFNCMRQRRRLRPLEPHLNWNRYSEHQTTLLDTPR